MTGHQCVRPDADAADPWRCPNCGMVWESLSQQSVELHAEHQVDTQEQAETLPWAERPLNRGGVVAGVVMGGIVGLALLLQDQSPVLAAVLGALGLVILTWWFWLFVRK
ncbi:hypothetical protein GCM10022419_131600 [Nonomuraea rosea]|uniref:C2H2-type domain-containing protein n=1 Tax=Nonomuraea rosea TaxID=638574 RepID=A0ABP7A2H8_9ACTN